MVGKLNLFLFFVAMLLEGVNVKLISLTVIYNSSLTGHRCRNCHSISTNHRRFLIHGDNSEALSMIPHYFASSGYSGKLVKGPYQGWGGGR